MSLTSTIVAEQALQLIGDNTPEVVGQSPTFDNSTLGLALQTLYPYVVRTVAKQFGWDFARNVFTLALTGNAAPLGFSYEYTYPPFAVEIHQLVPATTDPNNPLPQNWTIGNALVSSVQTKVIWSGLQNARAVLNNAPSEATWDSNYQEAVVRLLASELAMAGFGRPDTAAAYLESFEAFATLGESRPG